MFSTSIGNVEHSGLTGAQNYNALTFMFRWARIKCNGAHKCALTWCAYNVCENHVFHIYWSCWAFSSTGAQNYNALTFTFWWARIKCNGMCIDVMHVQCLWKPSFPHLLVLLSILVRSGHKITTHLLLCFCGPALNATGHINVHWCGARTMFVKTMFATSICPIERSGSIGAQNYDALTFTFRWARI